MSINSSIQKVIYLHFYVQIYKFLNEFFILF